MLWRNIVMSRPNTIAENYRLWQNYDWGRGGDEWNPSLQWKRSLINNVLLKYVEPEKTVLEIGPGAGRWTETLQKIAKRLILVDLSDKCIDICKERFSRCNNIEYFVNDGSDLNFIPSKTIDFIWSFDVFVHINPATTEKYIIGFSRILKEGGRGIIHCAKDGGLHGGWRSSMTAELFASMLKRRGLHLVTQFDSWGENGQFHVRDHHDIISVFERGTRFKTSASGGG